LILFQGEEVERFPSDKHSLLLTANWDKNTLIRVFELKKPGEVLQHKAKAQ
jgi:hypothetical protein